MVLVLELAALLVAPAAPWLALLMRLPFALVVAYPQVASQPVGAGLQVALLRAACFENLLAEPLPMAQTLALVHRAGFVQHVPVVVVLRAALLDLRHAAFFGVFLPQFVSLFLRLLVLVAGCHGDSLHRYIRLPL